jgi:hypothetical protein
MNLIFIYIILLAKEIKGKSQEYYKCFHSFKEITSPSNCTSIIIPESDGYKCCSMKISYENNIGYNCFPLEKVYSQNKEVLKEYMSKKSLSYLLSINGGQMEIECGDEIKYIENYEKLNDEFFSCYNGHIYGVKNESDCIEFNISEYERKCCFIETSEKFFGQLKENKRCYLIKDEYFNGKKNFNNYLLDQLNAKSLDQIKDINVTINCKNYDTYYFQGRNSEEEKKSGSKSWIIAMIVIIVILIVTVTLFLIYRYKKKKDLINIDNMFEKF